MFKKVINELISFKDIISKNQSIYLDKRLKEREYSTKVLNLLKIIRKRSLTFSIKNVYTTKKQEICHFTGPCYDNLPCTKIRVFPVPIFLANLFYLLNDSTYISSFIKQFSLWLMTFCLNFSNFDKHSMLQMS